MFISDENPMGYETGPLFYRIAEMLSFLENETFLLLLVLHSYAVFLVFSIIYYYLVYFFQNADLNRTCLPAFLLRQ